MVTLEERARILQAMTDELVEQGISREQAQAAALAAGADIDVIVATPTTLKQKAPGRRS